MNRTLLAAAALSVLLASPASAWNDIFNSIYGVKGNDTGGIIPWSPGNERDAYGIAESRCGFWNKYPVATSIHRVPGDYIVYRCVWNPPRVVQQRRYNRVDVTIEK